MRPFNDLTERGQVRRLRQLALNALAAYDIAVARLQFVAVHTNTLFRVRTADGQNYMLRICTPGEHSDADRHIEAAWLNALGDADFPTPQVILTTSGEPYVYANGDGVPEARACVLFSWIPGKSLDERESAENYARIGTLMAQLHTFAESYQLPTEFRPMQWNTTFYWDEPYTLDDPAYAHLITPQRRAILDVAIARVETYLQTLFSQSPTPPILLHGDMHCGNVHLHRNKLYALDFEDLMLGYPIQDIAITLYYGRDEPDYPIWRAALKEAYSAVRPWPEQADEAIDLLRIGRMLTFINYVTHAMPNEAEDYLSNWFPKIEAYLEEN